MSDAPSPQPTDSLPITPLDRRSFLRNAGSALALTTVGGAALAQQGGGSQPAPLPHADDKVQLPQIHAPSEAPEKAPGPFDPRDQRVGFAVVGIGRLSIDQILPAMSKSKFCKPVALVSGSSGSLDKAHKVADQYGIPHDSVYDYAHYEQLGQNPAVKVIYIVLPNSMHAEYTLRGAKLGKHILCEKPMATSVADCEKMIAACRAANVKLMIAYRQQYDPFNLALKKMISEGKLGKLQSIVASNTQNEGDPTQWRLNRKLAGGGPLPDVGIYCLNAARFLSGEEPIEVTGMTVQPKDDPRFREVESFCSFTLRFPSGLVAQCSSGYAGHRSQLIRFEGADAWAEMNPAFGYHGAKLRSSRLMDDYDTTLEPSIEEKDQFAEEMDHMALCVLNNQPPKTPGEEGLRDQRIIEAIYASARTGRATRM